MFDSIIVLLSVLLLSATLLPVWRHEAWWIRGLDFPRLQLFILAAALLSLELLALDLAQPLPLLSVLITVSCLVYQAWWILPYTRFYPVEVKSASSNQAREPQAFKIMTANVLMTNTEAEDLIASVQQHAPDILVTLESNQWWQEQLDKLGNKYPFAIKCPLDNLYGMHVYSRFEISDSQVEYLVEPHVPSMHGSFTLASGDSVYVHFLHPAPPSPVENEESAERDAELLLIAKQVVKHKQPVIVTGDLNDVAWSHTTRLFRKISGLLDPRIGRGMFNTFHAGYFFIRWPLDHLFHSHHFRVRSIKRLPITGSDHFALLTHLVYLPEKHNGERSLHPDDSDRRWAEEKLQNKGVKDEDALPLSNHDKLPDK